VSNGRSDRLTGERGRREAASMPLPGIRQGVRVRWGD